MRIVTVFFILLLLCAMIVPAHANPIENLSKQQYYSLLSEAKFANSVDAKLLPIQHQVLVNEGVLRGERNALDDTGGPDGYDYYFIDSEEAGGPVYSWVDITATGTVLDSMLDDDLQGPFDLGFTFSFYGQNYTQVYIGSNGYLSFNEETPAYRNSELPAADAPNNLICFFWHDMDPTAETSGPAYYGSDGLGNWVCTFDAVEEYQNGGHITCQVILKPNNEIVFQYASLADGLLLDGETIGIENTDGSMGLQVSYNTVPANYPYEGLAIRLYRQLATGIDLMATAASVSPSQVEANADVLYSVTVFNHGDTPSGAFSVELFYHSETEPSIGSTGDYTWNVAGLGASEVITLEHTASYPNAGDYSVYFLLDNANAVAEQLEDNNVNGPYEVAVISAIDIVIWNPDPTPNSGENALSILSDLGYGCIVVDDILDVDLTGVPCVMVFAGMYPNYAYILTDSPTETALIDYLLSGGNLYIEGGDMFGWATPENLMPFFHIAEADDGTNDLATVDGVAGTLTEGMQMAYGGENSYIDDYTMAEDAIEIFTNPADDQCIGGIFWDLETSFYKTAAFGFEVGNMVDGGAGNTREAFYGNLMEWFLTPTLFGNIEGTVVECTAGGPPLEGVEVYMNDVLRATTDASGHYSVQDMVVVPYEIRFVLPQYYEEVYAGFALTPDATVTLDAIMSYPEGSVTLEPIILDLLIHGVSDSTVSTTLDLSNIGCANLEWQADLTVLEVPWATELPDWFRINGPITGTLLPDEATTLTITADISAAHVGSPPSVNDDDVAFAELTFTGEPWAGSPPIDVVVRFVSSGNASDPLNTMPREYALHQNYPNPFNPTTMIQYDLVEAQDVLLTVHNLLGQQVAVLVNQRVMPGRHSVDFDASQMSSGLYFYRITSNAFSDVKKMVLTK